ncbi:Holliday junction branch migration protein RuvA [Rhodocytophaga rosea]|uniref:Holliday junction branch migration complex subunit RuvA n=1 Tax=Rhodocytophaga rosea TaxID=2704465 RepID=A0A6C0GEZ7_9BACT|nr:Holliday junction branch migration protein RuvA [Rhodocytophaga rosea]QHT66312.1 Holliday junction branch migration protein RuvA [Rhodocytophaga rosea]
MIAYIDGKLTFKDPTYVIIDIGGLGYHIKISLQTYAVLKEGERCRLHTFLHIKEDAHTLYGFAENAEKRLFLDLISVSGIGPNTAVMMLSSLSYAEIQNAIVSEDLRTIQSIKGIGSKTAQRVILELKDKIKKGIFAGEMPNIAVSANNSLRNEALSALITLGIPKNVAEKSIDTIMKTEGTTLSLEQLIKKALKPS